MLAKYRTVQVRKYKQFVAKQHTAQLVSFYDNANLPSLLGGKKFVEWVKATFFKGKIDLDIPQSKLLASEYAI